MIRSQLRQLAQHGDRARMGLTLPVRHFSASSAAASEGPSPPAAQGKPNQRPATSGLPRKPRASSRPPGPGSQNKPRPAARAIDARSFAAPRADGEPPKIIRKPRLRTGPPGKQIPGRKGKPAAKGGQKPRRKTQNRRSEHDIDDDEATAAAIKQLELDAESKGRPVPIRYEPQEIDFSTLKATWPALPTDVNARSAAVLEKLSTLSGRFPGGYVPPYELGRRLWKGQSVLFESEAEKAQALEEVKRLSQERAEKISLKKGETVKPRDIKFNPVSAEHTQKLMETFVQGKYPTLETSKDQPAIMSDVLRNIRNNATYQTAGKRPQFLAKVESLLASSRVKRS